MLLNQALDNIKQENTDHNGLIVQKDEDGGDTANRIGLLYAALKLLNYPVDHLGRPLEEGYKASMDLLEVDPGVYVRHPKHPWNDTGPKLKDGDMAFGRDQTDPLVIAMGLFGDQERLKRQVDGMVSRNYWYQSETDVVGPEQLATYARALNINNRPVLYIGDIATCFASLILIARSYRDPDDTSNDLNHILRLLFNQVRFPTIFNKLAIWLYSFRFNAGPKKETGLPRLVGFGPQTALDWYFRPSEKGPAINEVYISLTERLR